MKPQNQETKYKVSSDFFDPEDYEVLSYDEAPEEIETKGVAPYLAHFASDALMIGIEVAKETGLILLGTLKIARLGVFQAVVTMKANLERKRRVKRLRGLKDNYGTTNKKPKSPKKKVVITYEEW